ncbi:hypothetical protein WG66_006030 [Moniliophthora roreri]|nr:hypothetical protein WG66_006030 [Moniliophthora roreri]
MLFRPYSAQIARHVLHSSRLGRLCPSLVARNVSNANLRGKPSRIVSTLLPGQLHPSDFMDLSGLVRPRFNVLPNTQAELRLHYICHEPSKQLEFPQGTTGFLYFYRPSTCVPLPACTMRFRICESPEKFDIGKDLILPNGRPWEKSIHWMINNGLADALAEEGVITRKELRTSRTIFRPLFSSHYKTIVHALHQTFSVTLNLTTVSDIADIYIIGEDSLIPLHMTGFRTLKTHLHKLAPYDDKNLILKLHLEHDLVRDLIIRVSETASPPYDKYLLEGMSAPYIKLARHSKRQAIGNIKPREHPVQAGLRILQQQEKRAKGLL